jgi:hypothetical protein
MLQYNVIYKLVYSVVSPNADYSVVSPNADRFHSQWPHRLRHELSSPAPTLSRGFESHAKHVCLFLLTVNISMHNRSGDFENLEHAYFLFIMLYT